MADTTQPATAAPDALTIDAKGNVGIGNPAPQAALDVTGDVKVSGTVAAATLLGDGTGISVANSTKLQAALDAKFDKAGGPLSGPLAVAAINPPNDGGGHPILTVQGQVTAANLYSSNIMSQRMFPGNPVVYQSIFDAQSAGAIVKLGNPAYDNTTYGPNNPWQYRPIIQFGGNSEADGNGAQVTIPPGCDTVWLRVLGDRWNVVNAYFLDGAQEQLGQWSGGYRRLNSYCPDGSTSDSSLPYHQWIAIPAGRAGKLALISKPQTNESFWLSGLAFSSNPWGHATQSAVGYFWGVNGSSGVQWNTENWNNDVLAQIAPLATVTLQVPVVSNGKDKLLYFVSYNNNDSTMTYEAMTVNGNAIERLITTYDNPFARHWNSKLFERYLAAIVPASLIPAGQRWLTVSMERKVQNNFLYFREIGTHDLNVPWPV